jgi:aspartate/methionine/tyrosine aminotransferase
MKISPFKLERYFARYEFSAPFLLSCSDCEPLSLRELLSFGDEDALDLWANLGLGYTESQGHPLLREEIARLYAHIAPDDVLVVTPEEGIFIAMNVILREGDHVIATFPGYQSLYELAHSLGCEVTRWTPEKRGEWIFDVEDLKTLIQANTRLIVINFPHNPTGALPERNALEHILALARSRNIFVFSDEMYRLLEYDTANRLEPACDLYDGAVSLFGVSKSFALAGLRIGWLVTQNRALLRELAAFKDYTTICSSAPSEILALMALRAQQKIIKRNLDIIRVNLSILDAFFGRHHGLFEWFRPKAGSIAFPSLCLGGGISDFCLDLVDKKGVMLLPADVYDFPGNHFRLGFGRRNMPDALDRLEDYLCSAI